MSIHEYDEQGIDITNATLTFHVREYDEHGDVVTDAEFLRLSQALAWWEESPEAQVRIFVRTTKTTEEELFPHAYEH